MITIARSFEWDMGHRVPNHTSLCKNPHGHRYKLEVWVAGPIVETKNDPAEGMVIDFGDLKQHLSKLIDNLDHAFMYWNEDSVMSSFAEQNPDLKMVARPFIPTAERIAEHLAQEIEVLLAQNMPDLRVVKLVLYETPKSKAIWESA